MTYFANNATSFLLDMLNVVTKLK